MLARAAGCSRATLYNHFADRQALNVAFVNREAVRIARRVADAAAWVADPHDRATSAIVAAIEAVRSDPRLQTWFTGADVGVTTALSADSDVLDALGMAFAGGFGDFDDRLEIRRRARWVVRAIVSLLSMPAPDLEEERDIIASFVVPPLMSPIRR